MCENESWMQESRATHERRSSKCSGCPWPPSSAISNSTARWVISKQRAFLRGVLPEVGSIASWNRRPPVYSPDCSPIEETFSKIKAFLRWTGARTREALQEAISQALLTVTPQDAHGWFRHCCYPFKKGRVKWLNIFTHCCKPRRGVVIRLPNESRHLFLALFREKGDML